MDVQRVQPMGEGDEILRLLDEGKIGAIVYTGAAEDESLADYITLHRHALTLSIPCFTSLGHCRGAGGYSGQPVHPAEH